MDEERKGIRFQPAGKEVLHVLQATLRGPQTRLRGEHKRIQHESSVFQVFGGEETASAEGETHRETALREEVYNLSNDVEPRRERRSEHDHGAEIVVDQRGETGRFQPHASTRTTKTKQYRCLTQRHANLSSV